MKNKFKKFLSNAYGVTLVEVMVVAGVMGGLSLAFMKMMQVQSKGQKVIESKFEINQITSAISLTMLDGVACLNTFKPLEPLSAGTIAVTQIRNKANAVAYEAGQNYGPNNSILIERMELTGADAIPAPVAPETLSKGVANLDIYFQRVSSQQFGAGRVTRKTIPINIVLDTSDNLDSCSDTTANAIETARREACNDFGGTWNAGSGQCDYTQSVCDFYGGTWDPVANRCDSARLVTTTGGVDKFCIDGNCRSTFAYQDCGVGFRIQGINRGGSVTCADWIRLNGNAEAANFITLSDRTVKKDIHKIKSPLNIINGLKGVTFKYKNSDKHEVGFIAQEVEEVLPQVVHTTQENKKAIDYSKLTAVLAEAIKEQQRQIDELKQKLEAKK